MRKFTFTNSKSVATVFSADSDYKITSVSGLSTPPVKNQEQKAPFQDGSTYIDTLLNVREIIIDGAINKPNDLAAINLAKDTLIKNLSPKNGEGWLQYEASGGVIKKIKATPYILFGNKHAMEPFQKFKITFRCNDPYWQAVTDSTIALSTSQLSAEAVINSNPATSPSLIQQSTAAFRVAYIRGADGYLVNKTSTDGITWATEAVINGVSCTSPSLIQQLNTNFRVCYIRAADSYLYQRTSTDGTTWAAETAINAAACTQPSLIQVNATTFRVVYRRTSDGYLCQRVSTDTGATWAAETVINSAAVTYPSFIMQSTGAFRVAYIRSSDNYLVQRTSADGTTWAAESVINSAASTYASLIQHADLSFTVAYKRNSDGYLVRRSSSDGVAGNWGIEYVINPTACATPSIIKQADAKVRCAYIDNSDSSVRNIASDWTVLIGALETVSGTTFAKVNKNSSGTYFTAGSRIRYVGPDPYTDLTLLSSSDAVNFSYLSTIYTNFSGSSIITQVTDGGIHGVSPDFIIDANGKFFVTYQLPGGFVYAKTSTDNGVNWSTQITVVGAAVSDHKIYQLASGTYICIYRKTSDGFLYFRSSADGVTWGTDTTITNASSWGPAITQKSDGTIITVYRRGSDNYLVKKTSSNNGVTWSADSAIISAASNVNDIVKHTDGTYIIFFYRTASVNNGLMIRSYDDFATFINEKTIETNTAFNVMRAIQDTDTVSYRNDRFLLSGVSNCCFFVAEEQWGSVNTVNSGVSSYPSVVQTITGTYIIAYSTTASTFIACRTSTDGVSWSNEITINAFACTWPSLVLKSNGVLHLAYIKTSDGFMYQKTSSDNGATWSAESSINAVTSSDVSLCQQPNGSLRVVYKRAADSYLVQKVSTDDGATWGSITVINGAASSAPSIIALADGSFRVAYIRTSDSYLVQRTSSDGSTWSAESVINSASSNYPSIFQANGQIFQVFYRRNSDGLLVRRISSDGSVWTAEALISVSAATYNDVMLQNDGGVRVVYIRSSDGALINRTRTLTSPSTATVTGHVNTPIKINLYGPSTNPAIINNDTNEYMRLNKTLLAGDSISINTAFGQKTITLIDGGVTKNGMAYLDLGSTFFDLSTGVNTVYYEDDATSSTATATMQWTERYVGC